MLKNFKPRLYQQTIFSKTATANVLVVLPTGLGKTAIAGMLASYRLEHYKNSKILFLAPTKPLCDQHLESLKKMIDLPEEKFALFTGSVLPKKRHQMFKESQIIISTPQGLENDIISGQISLKDVSLIIFDEAHRATGNYSYVFIAEQYVKQADNERILALTASPGDSKETINEICEKLNIENIEIKTEEDPEVKQYLHDMDITWIKVELPEKLKLIKKYLEESYNSKIKEAIDLNVITKKPNNKTDLLKIQRGLHGKIAQGEKDFDVLKTISKLAEALKLQHALELIESQGVYPLKKYFDKIQHEASTGKSKAVKNLIIDSSFKAAVQLTKSALESNTDHPKVEKVMNIIGNEIKEKADTKIIIFTQFRDQAVNVKNNLDKKGFISKIFVGQAKKDGTGLSQKEQKQMLDEFRNGFFNVLIATSVAEEGLDIPQVDVVLFYEPTPSSIRTIQRRGRTARHAPGKIAVLVTTGTRDEGYRWSSHYKEKRMYSTLKKFQKELSFRNTSKSNTTLNDFATKEKENLPIIYVDFREKSSPTLRALVNLDVNLKLTTLDSGDYLVAHDTCIEFKRIEDFVDSLIDGRLFSQLRNLRKYPNAAILIEGDQDIFSVRQVHPNAIRGALATVALRFRVPIFFTKNANESAAMLLQIAKKEQEPEKNEFQLHQQKPGKTSQQQLFIISSLPGVGSKLAVPLLKKFKSIKGIVDATEEELQEVEKIGKLKAKKIKELIEAKFDPDHEF